MVAAREWFGPDPGKNAHFHCPTLLDPSGTNDPAARRVCASKLLALLSEFLQMPARESDDFSGERADPLCPVLCTCCFPEGNYFGTTPRCVCWSTAGPLLSNRHRTENQLCRDPWTRERFNIIKHNRSCAQYIYPPGQAYG
jgi:hypothetical protein